MPSHRDLEDLDAITHYFENRSLEEFERDEAEANPPVPVEAMDRPPVRGPRAPTQSHRPAAPLEEEVDNLKQRLAVVELRQEGLEEALIEAGRKLISPGNIRIGLPKNKIARTIAGGLHPGRARETDRYKM